MPMINEYYENSQWYIGVFSGPSARLESPKMVAAVEAHQGAHWTLRRLARAIRRPLVTLEGSDRGEL